MKKDSFVVLFVFIMTVILVIIPNSDSLVSPERDTDYISYSFKEALENNAYNEKEIFTKGLQEIEIISSEIEEFEYWKDCEIVDFHFLHSFETGSVTHALFEVLGNNNQYGYMIYDCVNLESDSFSAAESPYAGTDRIISAEIIESDFMNESGSNEIYYFYAPMTYGVGVVNSNGIRIYSADSIRTEKFDEIVYKTEFF